jgi:hypothetical protein
VSGSSTTAPTLSPWPFGMIDPKAVAHQSFRLIENGVAGWRPGN